MNYDTWKSTEPAYIAKYNDDPFDPDNTDPFGGRGWDNWGDDDNLDWDEDDYDYDDDWDDDDDDIDWDEND